MNLRDQRSKAPTAVRIARSIFFALLLGTIALPAALGSGKHVDRSTIAFQHLSQSVVFKYWMAHPDQAPSNLRAKFEALASARGARVPAHADVPPFGDRFNDDDIGYPQNEESVGICHSGEHALLSGTNDYRGILDPEGNFTGWHFSTDSGATLAKEGLLPPVTISTKEERPSGGDPVDTTDADCNLYGASLNYDPINFAGVISAVGVYKSDASTLLASNCGDDGPSDRDCWPNRRAVAECAPLHLCDKEWIDVADSGEAGRVVWIGYFDVDCGGTPDCSNFQGGSIKAVRCSADLSSCTAPILISGDDADVQFADVTIANDGRTYISWAEILGELEGTPQTFVVKIRVAEPGSTDFGPTQVVTSEEKAIPFGGFLQGNTFRTATYPKNTVKMVDGSPRIFMTWDKCTERTFDVVGLVVCNEPKIKLAWSDDFGATWSTKTLSKSGVNYFPTIANDSSDNHFVVAWYTNRFDGQYQNAQDVEMVTVDSGSVSVIRRQRVTNVGLDQSNETEADPLLNAFFIGDYFEVAAHKGTAYLAYNANIHDVKVFDFVSGEFATVATPQQDNFLTVVSE